VKYSQIQQLGLAVPRRRFSFDRYRTSLAALRFWTRHVSYIISKSLGKIAKPELASNKKINLSPHPHRKKKYSVNGRSTRSIHRTTRPGRGGGGRGRKRYPTHAFHQSPSASPSSTPNSLVQYARELPGHPVDALVE